MAKANALAESPEVEAACLTLARMLGIGERRWVYAVIRKPTPEGDVVEILLSNQPCERTQ